MKKLYESIKQFKAYFIKQSPKDKRFLMFVILYVPSLIGLTIFLVSTH